MKTIMYISQSTEAADANGLPQSLTSVIVGSRRKNKERGIRGLLCCHRGYFLHVLEGNSNAVDDLFNTIKQDARHKNIKILVDTPSAKAYLDDLPFKLASIYQPITPLIHYVNNYLLTSYPAETNAGEIFKNLREGHSAADSADEKSDNAFVGQLISLTQWPKFDVVSPTRELLELCAVLTRKVVSYEVLSANNPYANELELNRALNSLQSMSLLEMDFDPSAEVNMSNGAFFSKMKGFISRLRA